MKLRVNDQVLETDATPDTPLLWVLRDYLNLTGTKFGCGKALCGSCTVHVDGNPVRSCAFPVSAVAGMAVVTIEGLSSDGNHPVQKAWRELNVPQCGYCQSGQIMTAIRLLERIKKPKDEDIDGAMTGNVCRCATYVRIRQAIKSAAAKPASSSPYSHSAPGGPMGIEPSAAASNAPPTSPPHPTTC